MHKTLRRFLRGICKISAQDNLKIIIELTDRLADIVGQFKSFTRKSQGTDSATDINRCITQALTIVQPAIDKQGVELDVQLPDGNYQVWGIKSDYSKCWSTL